MKFLWILVVVIFIINEAKTKSLNNNASDVIKNDITKSSLLSMPAEVSERRTIGLFPRIAHKVNKPSVSWKPIMKINNKENIQQKRKPLMRKLEIRNEDHKSKDSLRMKPTTRRPLMTIRRFTIKPHQVHSESVRGRRVWERKGGIRRHNSDNTHRNANKNNSRTNEEISSEDRERENTDIDSDENVNQVEVNDNIAAGSQNLKTVIFPRRNKIYTSTNKSEPHINSSINAAVSSDKSPTNTSSTNKQNAYDKIMNNFNVTAQEQGVKPEDAGAGRALLKDIPNKGDEVQKLAPNSKLGTTKDEVAKNDVNILDLRPKRSVNVIEEEVVATSYPKSRITSREFVINYDLKFKNINT